MWESSSSARPKTMTDAYVGFGSNLDPESNLREALAGLSKVQDKLCISQIYRSPAYGFTGADFLNLVISFEWHAGPEALKAELSAVERAGGRRDSQREGSRTLDLDLLLYGLRVDAMLRLPRDDVLDYPFVLAPLNDLAANLVHPVTGTTVADAWRTMLKSGPQLTCLGAAGELLHC